MYKYQCKASDSNCGTCDATKWFISLRQNDVHSEVARTRVGTFTAAAGGVLLSGRGAAVQTEGGS